MRRRNPQLAEDGFHLLREVAADHIEAALRGRAVRGLHSLDTLEAHRLPGSGLRTTPVDDPYTLLGINQAAVMASFWCATVQFARIEAAAEAN